MPKASRMQGVSAYVEYHPESYYFWGLKNRVCYYCDNLTNNCENKESKNYKRSCIGYEKCSDFIDEEGIYRKLYKGRNINKTNKTQKTYYTTFQTKTLIFKEILKCMPISCNVKTPIGNCRFCNNKTQYVKILNVNNIACYACKTCNIYYFDFNNIINLYLASQNIKREINWRKVYFYQDTLPTNLRVYKNFKKIKMLKKLPPNSSVSLIFECINLKSKL